MFKTICLLALIALSYTQDVTSQQVTDAVNQAANAATTTTVGDAIDQATSVVQNNDVNAIASTVPALSNLTVGWGPREVLVTPQASNPTLNDWLNGTVNVARESAAWDEGEWTLQWSVENGDDYALLHQADGDFVIVDWTSGAESNWGVNDALDAEIANGAEQLVDYVYDNEVDSVQGQTIVDWLSNVLNNDNVNGFLNNNNGQTVADAAADALNQATNSNADIAAAVDQATNAVNNAQTGTVVDQAVDAVNQVTP